MASPLRKAELISRRELTASVLEVDFQMVEPERIEYESGQFIILHTAEVEGKRIKRSYSIASPPNPHRFRLCIKILPNGISSNFIRKLETGDCVLFSGPWGKGKFTLPVQAKEILVFVATGTGISPIFALLSEHLPRSPHKKFELLWGLRHELDLFYLHQLDCMSKSFPNFQYSIVLSRPSQEWEGYCGRVTGLLEPRVGALKEAEWFLAGNGNMIADLNKKLLDSGVPDGCIHKETFFTPQ